MNLNQLENFWDNIGEDDPLWGILSDPQKRGNIWNETEFFTTGKIEIDALFSEYLSIINFNRENPALDFGCGIGRCTRRLANYFPTVTGVDLSGAMIQKAKNINKDINNCSFVHNSKDNLEIFENESVGFVFSILTLQHIPSNVQLKYLKEFCRVLKRDGILVFQAVTSYSLNIKGILRFLLGKQLLKFYNKNKYKLKAPIEMHLLKKKKIIKLLEKNNMLVIRKINDHAAGSSFLSYKFICRKNNL
jgi:ubiquinone/menaquinone biosynthesis C-methylase UbiE